jgi:probable rRNA maturation factor
VSVVQVGRPSSGAKGLGRWLARIAPRSARGAVDIAILPDRRVKALNRKYRKKNAGTDVLSFPDRGAIDEGTRALQAVPFLGDIAISRGIAQKQAKIRGHSIATEFRVLALHGLLHLLGYDHDSDDGRMARAEARLRRKARLPSGLIARSS